MPLSICTWNSANLFGTISGDVRRRRKKRQYVESLIAIHDIVGLQETRGSPGDLATLPQADHAWYGSFFAYSVVSGGSRRGGVVLGLSRRLLAMFPRVEHIEIVSGRAQLVRCRREASDEGVAIFNVHLEPGLPIEAKKRLIDSVWAHSWERPVLVLCGGRLQLCSQRRPPS